MEKRNCIIVHGCISPAEDELKLEMDPRTRTYDKHWMPWVKKHLLAKGIRTDVPMMPTPWYPTYDNYKGELEKYPVNENTILVGHSCGSAFLVRWLGETKRKIQKLILVAPWKIPSDEDGFKHQFYTFAIDRTIRERVKSITIFTSDNEEPGGKKSVVIFHKALGGTIIELQGRGHYIQSDMGTVAFPELVKVIMD